MKESELGSNPYVGPRAFKEGEELCGRKQELLRLLHLIIAERVVILYSPSGAGKTSLIQAGLIPALKKKNFRILGPMRVGRGLSPEEFPLLAENRYLSSLLLSLDYQPLAGQQIPQNLAGCLDQLARDTDTPSDEVLIFDQFEEILTLDPTDVKAKEVFFAQIGEVLEARHRWALFALREEYLAALEPYAHFISTRLQNSFRLDLLSIEAACEAIREPADKAGVDFTEKAAQKLVQDLCKVWVQQPDGSFVEQTGPHVEPVQLQVVCQRLWENHQTQWEKLPPAERQITEHDLEEFGDVNSALAQYYADRVAAVARDTQVPERELREWFDRHLITSRGIRGQVLLGETKLDEKAIQALVDTHLVRRDKRHGATWFELAHDRLIRPVRENNKIWFGQNLQPFQRQADVWEKMGSPPNGPFLTGYPLREAEQWIKTNNYQLQEEENLFLDGCRKKRLIWRAGLLGGFVLLAACIVSILALLHANHQAKLSEALQSASTAFAHLAIAPERSIDFALEAIEGKEDRGGITSHTVRRRAEDALHRSMFACRLSEHHISDEIISGWTPDKFSKIFFSPDNRRFASISLDNSVKIREAAPGKLPESIPVKDVHWAAFNQDGSRLAMACKDLTIKIWDVDKRTFITRDDGKDLTLKIWDVNKKTFITRDDRGDLKHKSVLAIKFNKEGDCLAATGEREINLWKSDTLEEIKTLKHGDLKDFDFSPDGGYIATAGWDGQVFIWRIPFKQEIWKIPPGKDCIEITHGRSLKRVKFSPTGNLLVTISDDDGVAKVWDISPPDSKDWKFAELDLIVNSEIAFSPDGKFLALPSKLDYLVYVLNAAVLRNAIQPCNIDKRENLISQQNEKQEKTKIPMEATLSGHTSKVTQLSFLHNGESPEFRFMVTASEDATIKIWDIFTNKTLLSLAGHLKPVKAIAVHPDFENSLVSVGWDGHIRFWDIGIGHTSAVNKVVFDKQGNWIATAGSDGTARIWDTENGKELKCLGGNQEEKRINAIAFNPHSDKKGSFLYGKELVAGSKDVFYCATPHSENVIKFSLLKPRILRIDNIIFSAKYMAIQAVLMLEEAYYSKILVINTDEADSFKPIHTLPSGKRWDNFECIAISPQEGYLAAGLKDGRIMVWDLDNHDGPVEMKSDQSRAHQDRVLSVAFSKNGVLASASADTTVKLWKLNNNNSWTSIEMEDNPTFNNKVKSVAFSHDGNHLAAGSSDRRVKIFELDPENRNMQLEHDFSHPAGINDVAFSPDDKKLAVACDDNQWYIHTLDLQDSVRQADTRLKKWGIKK
jgi:WD40 repeat protein